MSAFNSRQSKKSGMNSMILVGGIIAAGAIVLFAYLMFYTAPVENIERVTIIAVTEAGCIGETVDGFSVNIGECQAQPGDSVMAPVDQKAKERAAAMNPTS